MVDFPMKNEQAIHHVSFSDSVSLPRELLERGGFSAGEPVVVNVSDGRIVIERCRGERASSDLSDIACDILKKCLETPLRAVTGVGPALAEKLARRGIRTVDDALHLFPLRHEDRRSIFPISRLEPGRMALFSGVVRSAAETPTRRGKRFFEAVVQDQSGTILCKWFGYHPYLKNSWKPGKRGVFIGLVSLFDGTLEVHHPDAFWLRDDEKPAELQKRDPLSFGGFVPVYPALDGVHQRTVRRIMKTVVDRFAPSLESFIPEEVIRRQGLIPLCDAFSSIHFPRRAEEVGAGSRATRTAVFDELFYLQLGLALRRQGIRQETGISFQVTHRYTRPLLDMLPFRLTDAQRRVLTEIKHDMMAPHPMHRLVQGDVGCGKTLVAFLAALVAVENGYQVAIMAPTEILAEQHYLNVHGWSQRLGITTALLTSSVSRGERSRILAGTADGQISILVGTHAVIQEGVDFARLGLGIIDEQHRFGVVQRGRLKRKGVNPDILVLTATPIPRTLAMTLFGDLSMSVIDELPPGRQPVATRVVAPFRREEAYRLTRDEVGRGRQAYVICPLVEESEKSALADATSHAARLGSEVFPHFRIGLLHGRMKPDEKESVMRRFKEREIDILVSTTVIEVGIDVPNATVIMIEHAERFGLSQLHQLRGRVGRGTERSYCLLMASENVSDEGLERLRVMERSNDGFAIAEADLKLRGPGDLLGTRQSGLPDLRVADVLRDAEVLEAARIEAFDLIRRDPDLSLPEHRLVKRELFRRWEGRLELATIG